MSSTSQDKCRTIGATLLVTFFISIAVIAGTLVCLWLDLPIMIYPTLMIAFIVAFPFHDLDVIKGLNAVFLPNAAMNVLYYFLVGLVAIVLHMLYYFPFEGNTRAKIAITVLLGLIIVLFVMCILFKNLYQINNEKEIGKCNTLLNCVNTINS